MGTSEEWEKWTYSFSELKKVYLEDEKWNSERQFVIKSEKLFVNN